MLALDVRSNRIGFAAFDGNTLLDAGITRFKSPRAAIPRLVFLMRRTHPRILVLRRILESSSRNSRGTRTILRAAHRIAKRSSVRVAFVSQKQIQERFLKDGITTKYEIALFLVRAFPDLAWRLPLPRRAWQAEHRNMALFDAVALGMAYLTGNRMFAL